MISMVRSWSPVDLAPAERARHAHAEDAAAASASPARRSGAGLGVGGRGPDARGERDGGRRRGGCGSRRRAFGRARTIARSRGNATAHWIRRANAARREEEVAMSLTAKQCTPCRGASRRSPARGGAYPPRDAGRNPRCRCDAHRAHLQDGRLRRRPGLVEQSPRSPRRRAITPNTASAGTAASSLHAQDQGCTRTTSSWPPRNARRRRTE